MEHHSAHAVDSTDLQLLNALQRDADTPHYRLAEALGVSPATVVRRLRRLRQLGLIERQVALLQPDRLAQATGHALLTAILEVHLDRQGHEHLAAFADRAVLESAVQQCYRTASGPDFVLIVSVADMPGYLAFSERLLTQDANVRNVKAYFSVHRHKFDPAVALPPSAGTAPA